MAKFKLLATGYHYEGGERYGKGDIIESNFPLDKMFRNKFERLPEPIVIREPLPESEEEGEESSEGEVTRTPKKKSKKKVVVHKKKDE